MFVLFFVDKRNGNVLFLIIRLVNEKTASWGGRRTTRPGLVRHDPTKRELLWQYAER